MGITERREREREEIRQKILDAARDLFTSEGYEKVTMRAIADAIEYSPTTIYNHFEDKEDVVRSLCELDFARLLGALRERPAPDDPVEWIRELGVAYARFGLAYPNHYRFMFMTAAKLQERLAVAGKGLDDEQISDPGELSFALLRGAVARAIETGRFRADDPDGVAQVLWATLHGAVALLITLPPELWPGHPAVPDLVERVIDVTLRGLVAADDDTR